MREAVLALLGLCRFYTHVLFSHRILGNVGWMCTVWAARLTSEWGPGAPLSNSGGIVRVAAGAETLSLHKKQLIGLLPCRRVRLMGGESAGLLRLKKTTCGRSTCWAGVPAGCQLTSELFVVFRKDLWLPAAREEGRMSSLTPPQLLRTETLFTSNDTNKNSPSD